MREVAICALWLPGTSKNEMRQAMICRATHMWNGKVLKVKLILEGLSFDETKFNCTCMFVGMRDGICTVKMSTKSTVFLT